MKKGEYDFPLRTRTLSLNATFSKTTEPTFLNWHISEQNDCSSKFYLFAQQRNLQQKQQLTTSFFIVKGDRIRDLNGVGKIRNITGAYELNINEKIKKITK